MGVPAALFAEGRKNVSHFILIWQIVSRSEEGVYSLTFLAQTDLFYLLAANSTKNHTNQMWVVESVYT